MSSQTSSEVLDLSYSDAESFTQVQESLADVQDPSQHIIDDLPSQIVGSSPEQTETFREDVFRTSDNSPVRHDTYYFNDDMIEFLVRTVHSTLRPSLMHPSRWIVSPTEFIDFYSCATLSTGRTSLAQEHLPQPLSFSMISVRPNSTVSWLFSTLRLYYFLNIVRSLLVCLHRHHA